MIDPINRQYLAQGHSATHLLHNALKIVIDKNIGQKGSAIESQHFTFDYNYNKALTNDQIYNIEDLVNSYIRQNHKVKTSIMDINKAINNTNINIQISDIISFKGIPVTALITNNKIP